MTLYDFIKNILKRITCPCEKGTWKTHKEIGSDRGVEHTTEYLICDECGSIIMTRYGRGYIPKGDKQ